MSTTEYLTEIKFRNAVKRTVTGRVAGKSEFTRFATHIDQVWDSETRDWSETMFKVWYRGGDWAKNDENRLEGQLKIERELFMAGFEALWVDENVGRGEMKKTLVWRKAVA